MSQALSTPMGVGRRHQPATLGKRAWARTLDGVLGSLFSAVWPLVFALAAFGASGSAGLMLWLSVAGPIAYAVFGLVALTRAATPGQLLVGLYHVDVDTGEPAPARTFLKLMLQTVTFGLWIVITPLTLQPPNRSWFDRTAGVTVLDRRRATGAVEADPLVTAPPQGWSSDGHLTQARALDTEALGTSLPAASERPQSPPAEGMIRAVPFDLRRPASGAEASSAPQPTVPPRPAVQIREHSVARVVPPAGVAPPVSRLGVRPCGSTVKTPWRWTRC